MTARVLVVDDILANVKLLEARLTAEYFDVMTAMSGQEALDICETSQCDIILLDVMMPGLDGFETCRRLKNNPKTAHIPVVMVTALDQPSDRVQGLEAGADDFLTKPVSDIALITRVKSLVRLKMLTDELRMRSATTMGLGLQEDTVQYDAISGENGKILLVDDRRSSSERIQSMLNKTHDIDIEPNPDIALQNAAEKDYELFIISLSMMNYDSLRLCSQIRSLERTRMVPILVVSDPEDEARLLRGLDLGVNDYLVRPLDKNELHARVRTQIRKKRYADELRTSVQTTMEMAITDALTSLHNRRYLETHLASMVGQAAGRGRPLSAFIMDIDFFKSINDTYGHDVGDEVLREFAARIRNSVRGIDLACRFGGEEFVVVMPDTDLSLAYSVAERLRESVANEPFTICGGTQALDVTISIGVSTLDPLSDTPETLLKRADEGLYTAKREGRNRVIADAA